MILSATAIFSKKFVDGNHKLNFPEIVGVGHCVVFKYSNAIIRYYYIEVPVGRSSIVEPRILPITSMILLERIKQLPGFKLEKPLNWRQAVRRYGEPIAKLSLQKYKETDPVVWEYETQTKEFIRKRRYDITKKFDKDKPTVDITIYHYTNGTQ
jgi:hypothetical protein